MDQTSIDKMAEPLTTLADLRRVTRANKIHSINVFTGTNLGRNTLTSRMSIADFYELSAVGNRETVQQQEHQQEFVAQRTLIPAHARGLAIYVLKGLVMSAIIARRQSDTNIEPEIYAIRDDLAGGPYAALQPIVCNIRALKPGGDDLPVEYAATKDLPFFRASLTSSQKLWVVDGQHRREAFGIVIKYLDDINKNGTYPRTKNSLYSPPVNAQNARMDQISLDFWREVHDLALQECSVTVEIHLGLGNKEEGQLFADLNSRGKTLHSSLLAQFDKSDAIAAMVGEKLLDGENPIIRFPVQEESDAKSWEDAGLTLKDVVMVNRLLVHGNNSPRPTAPSEVVDKMPIVEVFWKVIQSIPGLGEKNQRSKTVAGQPVVLKALAKLAFDHAFGVPKLRDQNGLKELYGAISTKRLSFDHSEPLWQALFMNENERDDAFPGINEFVYLGDQFKGGEYDETNGFVRFGPAHNDIFPRLGDIIRWKLGLKDRGAAAKARLKLLAREIEHEDILEA